MSSLAEVMVISESAANRTSPDQPADFKLEINAERMLGALPRPGLTDTAAIASEMSLKCDGDTVFSPEQCAMVKCLKL
jgi:hypothetical protein